MVATARTASKARAAVDAVEARTGAKIEGAVLDLASLESVRSFPERLKRDRVDVLVENAGVMAIPDRSTTEDGFERQIGVNFLGHYALVGALLPKLEKAGTFRIVCVSSDASKLASASGIDAALAEDLDPAAYSAWGNYALSKAFNVLFASELQRRLDARGLPASAVALHPGMVQTDLARFVIGGSAAADAPPDTAAAYDAAGPAVKFLLRGLKTFVLPVEVGANTQVFLAAEPSLATNGGAYFDAMKPAKANPATRDADRAGRLWALSEKLTKAHIDL